jgi:hypothetical protein
VSLPGFRRLAGLTDERSLTEATARCPMSLWLIEDLKSVRDLLDGDFEQGSPERKVADEFRAKWEGGTPFKVQCNCGRDVTTVLRGNNWRVPGHAKPKE